MTQPITLIPQGVIIQPDADLEDFTAWIGLLLECQRDVLWQLGDLCLAVERKYPEVYHQAYPEGTSPDNIGRCKAVAAAYKQMDRNIRATWSIHMNNKNSASRVALVKAAVEAGQTSDENRKSPALPEKPVDPPKPADLPVPVEEPPAETIPEEPEAPPEVIPEAATALATSARQSGRWLMCIDVSYYLQRQWAKDGVDAARTLCEWLNNHIERLKETKNLTDVVICFDGPNNHRKEITDGWEIGYKSDRPKKEPEYIALMVTTRELLERSNRCCVSIDGMEADDLMASYAAQFDGKVSLMTSDKDLRQCLSTSVNILRDITWEQHPETGAYRHVYDWVRLKDHLEDGCNYPPKVKGISPELWPHFQAIAGDSNDTIKGCKGIGGKIAMDLVHAHGTVQNIIEACRTGMAALTDTKVQSVLDFAPFAEATLKLTTMRTDLPVPMTTRIPEKE